MRAALLSAALVAAGCVGGKYRRVVQLEPLPNEWFESLEVGTSTLDTALQRLGAPLYVWEQPGGRFALAWGWLETQGWGVDVSVPVSDAGGSASFDYEDEHAKTRGWILYFDDQGRLVSMRSGYLRELGAELQRVRPALIED